MNVFESKREREIGRGKNGDCVSMCRQREREKWHG